MRVLLEKHFKRGQLVELMYLSKTGVISKRKVKILDVQAGTFRGFCYKRGAKRTFLIENVLAIVPVIYKERGVI